tara:strand:- start:5323 stop:5658 length:336 start_codon:yes stop_codon:yes gene_type:complete
MNVTEKRLYIYNIYRKNKDDDIDSTILFFVKSNNISYTENKNGIFFNLSTINENYIHQLYELLETININKNMKYNAINISDEDLSEEEETHIKDIVFTEREKKLIEYSKGI